MDGPGLWGVVSDLDLVQATVGGELEDLTAGGTAVTPALTIAADDTLQHAAQLMSEHEVTHLVVVARDVEAAGRRALDARHRAGARRVRAAAL